MRTPQAALVLLALAMLFLFACDAPQGPLLVMRVQSDLTPGRELDSLVVELVEDGERRGFAPLSVGASTPSLLTGVRVAEAELAGPGLVTVIATARLRGGVVLTSRVQQLVERPSIVTVRIFRACIAVECPQTGDPEDATECGGGVCVPPTCSPELPEACPQQCAADAECDEGVCGAGRCLDRACFVELSDAACAPGERCAPDGTCEPEMPTLDGGAGDAGVCSPSEELCDGLDNDCDALVDEDFSLQTNALRCGACDRACEAEPNATPRCVAGDCDLECAPGFADCDASPGCESALSDAATCGDCAAACSAPTPFCSAAGGGGFECTSGCDQTLCGTSCVDTQRSVLHCGGCDRPCDLPNATARCVGGQCRVDRCSAGFADCDGSPLNGCETRTTNNLAHCGGCDQPCSFPGATAACVGSVCQFGACQASRRDCDGMQSNGCEVDTSGAWDCQSCGVACSGLQNTATYACASQSCVSLTCEPNYASCDGNAFNGCEADLRTDDEHCGSCDSPCGAGRHCEAMSCECDAGLSECGADCADLTSDVDHCGSCSSCAAQHPTIHVGSRTNECAGGVCECGDEPVCGAIQLCCPFAQPDGVLCINVDRNTSNCGACNVRCAQGETCGNGGTPPSGGTAGKCGCGSNFAERGAGPFCGPGQQCLGGTCVPL